MVFSVTPFAVHMVYELRAEFERVVLTTSSFLLVRLEVSIFRIFYTMENFEDVYPMPYLSKNPSPSKIYAIKEILPFGGEYLKKSTLKIYSL